MFDGRSKAGTYLSQAETLQLLADKTRYPEVRRRLLGLAASFERLAYDVEKWEEAGYPKAAAD
jgi:hypothetical protein